MRRPIASAPAVCSQFCTQGAIADRAPSLPAFFHHARIRGLKSSAISAMLIERTFKIVPRKPGFPVLGAEIQSDEICDETMRGNDGGCKRFEGD
ncbi:MAG: hypothetical protein E5Y88_13310 [Mesorhizobium sp.]|uniref:hypothetical protein n=1 Tax=Mesorhizobium TaxID=68287 RepID=UPI000FD3E9E7|nr:MULTISPECIES: hypothetical protein [Mesorhizobium]RVB75791.1 hypothetical protein EN885_18140 [Mesorhizobium sp. M6A.T.Cr.TU.014.01.1.1]RWN40204.1 MAG: hypothetical protein EOR96_17120 [Mesorhizobium sp.]RWP79368.1 MAG: hypothetical protein EOR10_11255 [Mesorhizobium sp.]RWQ03441.1 MAG: hypothetical protein EOR91_19345 [Mesorhizobium sp.]RWQ04244.1 MAG: hypothetical protein EOR90_16465 [Mesorhizobium sp.]